LIPDVSADARWPVFLAVAHDLQVGAVFLFPLTLGAACVGAALCYRDVAGGFGTEACDVGCASGRAISGQSLRRAILLAEGDEGDESAPFEMRREVHQATGMVVGQLDTNASDALARMRAYAFSNGVRLRDVARDVVTRRLDLPAETATAVSAGRTCVTSGCRRGGHGRAWAIT
jgi:hypothetical protein